MPKITGKMVLIQAWYQIMIYKWDPKWAPTHTHKKKKNEYTYGNKFDFCHTLE